MTRYSRIIVALVIVLSGVALIPQVGIFAGVVSWQRFAGGYEDVVTVSRARYRDGELEVRANSTAGGAPTLTVYRTADNAFIGTLVYNGSEHRGEFNVGSDPHVITVRSSLGGYSTVLTWDESDPPITVTPSITPTSPPQPTETVTSTPNPNATNTPTTVPGATETPTATIEPGSTSTPTIEPGSTSTATVEPDSTSTPTTEPGSTNTPTATPPTNSSTLYLPLIWRDISAQ